MGDSAEQVQRRARDAEPRILQVLPALGEGGVERDTIDLARHLAVRGWTPLVASGGGQGERELERLGVATFRLPLQTKNPLAIRGNIGRLERLVRDQGVQLIHAHSRAPAWSACHAAGRCGVPLVTTVHGVYGGGRLKQRYNAVMARGDRVIAISEHVAAHVRERYGVAADRLRLVHRGIDIGTFDPDAIDGYRIDRLRRHWQLPRGTKIIMLPGRVTRAKGHLLLLGAIAQMSERDIVCLLVGPFERNSAYPREIEREAATGGLDKVVRLVGGCADMPAALALADVVVVPSTGPEAFGRVSVEAQALGRPVVVTDVGGLGETLMPAATGWLVPPDDPAELARALALALAMPDDARARLKARARQWVERQFTAERMAERTIGVYRELLGAEAPAGADLPARVPPERSDE